MLTLDEKDTENFLGQNTQSILKDLRETKLTQEDLEHLLVHEQKREKPREKVTQKLKETLENNIAKPASAQELTKEKKETSKPAEEKNMPTEETEFNCACPKCGYLGKGEKPPTCPNCGTEMVFR